MTDEDDPPIENVAYHEAGHRDRQQRGMTFANGFSKAEAQLLVTLSGFAYLAADPLPGETIAAQQARMRQDIDAALAASYPTWRVVWGPGLSPDRGNMLYVAGQPDTPQLAVAIRGTDWDFWLNWIQDFATLLPPIPYPDVLPQIGASDPRIAVGTNLGLQLLLGIHAPDAQGLEMDVTTFLTRAGNQAETYITGHSLGGCLATVLATSLAYRLGSATTLKPYPFAGPTAGNQGYADYYDQLFTDSSGRPRAFRVYNDKDIVPASWASLPAIGRLYRPEPKCSQRVHALLRRVQEFTDDVYVQPGVRRNGSAHRLRGQVLPPTAEPGDSPDRNSVLFFQQVDYQHATDTYMQLLDAPRIPPALASLFAAEDAFR